MPRRPRITLPDIPLHVIQRGNNRQPCFAAEEDYHAYLEWLAESMVESACEVHAYMLMTNHVHLLVTPRTPQAVGSLMKRLGQRYVQYFNRSYGRSGTLWEGRFRSCLIEDENYLLTCHRYIELNPVRAGMVEHPGDYRWSSYRTNAQGETNAVVTPHPIYVDLGCGDASRQSAYRELFRNDLDPERVDEVRSATNANLALGSERFQAEVEAMLQRRVRRGKPGRPKVEKVTDTNSSLDFG